MTAPYGASPAPAIFIILDGWTRRVFDSLFVGGRLPEIRDWLVSGAELIPEVVSIVPSISLSSHATLLTGTPPSMHGIPGHRWLNTDTRRVRDYIGLGVRHVNNDVWTTVSTAFECHGVNSFATQSVVSRGADKTRRLPTQSPGRILESALKTFRRNPHGIHVIWLPGGDAASHRYGPDSEEFAKELEMTSKFLGLFVEGVRQLSPEAGMLAVPDHGQRGVKKSSRIRHIDSWAPESLSDTPTVVNPQYRMQRQADEVVLLTGGDSSVGIYPAQKFADSRVADLARELASSGQFEYLVHSAGETHTLYGLSGIAQFETANDDWVHYRVLEGVDPLSLGSELLNGRIRTDLPITSGPYPDFVSQYLSSRVQGRSAPLVGFARDGSDFGWGPRPGWRLGRHRGSHGGGSRDEVLVSALVDVPGLRVTDGPVRSHELLAMLGIGTPTRSWANSA